MELPNFGIPPDSVGVHGAMEAHFSSHDVLGPPPYEDLPLEFNEIPVDLPLDWAKSWDILIDHIYCQFGIPADKIVENPINYDAIASSSKPVCGEVVLVPKKLITHVRIPNELLMYSRSEQNFLPEEDLPEPDAIVERRLDREF